MITEHTYSGYKFEISSEPDDQFRLINHNLYRMDDENLKNFVLNNLIRYKYHISRESIAMYTDPDHRGWAITVAQKIARLLNEERMKSILGVSKPILTSRRSRNTV